MTATLTCFSLFLHKNRNSKKDKALGEICDETVVQSLGLAAPSLRCLRHKCSQKGRDYIDRLSMGNNYTWDVANINLGCGIEKAE